MADAPDDSFSSENAGSQLGGTFVPALAPSGRAVVQGIAEIQNPTPRRPVFHSEPTGGPFLPRQVECKSWSAVFRGAPTDRAPGASRRFGNDNPLCRT